MLTKDDVLNNIRDDLDEKDILEEFFNAIEFYLDDDIEKIKGILSSLRRSRKYSLIDDSALYFYGGELGIILLQGIRRAEKMLVEAEYEKRE